MQSTSSKVVSKSLGQTDAGVKTSSLRVDTSVRTGKAVQRIPHRSVPVMTKERIALFSGIETSTQFTSEAVYAAFAGKSQTT